MADIFMSYAHGDRQKVEKLAAALEDKGYSVWWDRHIVGGAEFSKDIETALKDAKVVIVAWSAGAIDSHWVRDEAVYARDNNILIPIRVDETETPLGFRQVQAIDFNNWNGSPDHGAFRELTRALKTRLAQPASEPEPEHSIVPPTTMAPETPKLLNPRVVAGGIAALAIAVLISTFVPRSGNAPETATTISEVEHETAADKSIAVLPFAALSNDDSDEYFGKGIAEELLNALAQFPDLKVAARTSAFSFDGQNTDLRDVGEKLGVAHVLEGSVRRAGDTVRITAQLIRVADGFHLWSETYERELNDVFAIQDEIVREISKNLQVRLGVGGGTGRASGEGVDPQAYEQYLRGLTLWGERDRAPGNRRAAITVLQRSTQFDPEFAGAWSALGLFGAFSGAASLGLDPDDFAKQTKEALDRAIALDPNNATASAGLVSWHATRELNIELGQHYLEQALSLAPNKAESHYVAANFWSVTGDAEEAIAAYERAIALDPLNLTMQRVYAEFLLITGRPEDAFAFFDACMENRCLVAGIELFALAAAVVAGDETRIANWSPAAISSLGPNAEPPSFPFLFRAFVSIANDQSDAATFVEALSKIPPGALPNELQGIWAPVLADYVQKDTLFTSQKNGLRHGGLLGSPYAMAPYYGANPYPEWVLRDPRYHALWAEPGMAELAAARRANGQTAGLPLPIEGDAE